MIDLTPESALALIKPFFPEEWAQCSVSDVEVYQIKAGAANSITVVTRRCSDANEIEPKKLLIRMKGGAMVDNDQLPFNTDVSSALIEYEMSRRKLGPKIYGVFQGGTIQEFIESHTLAPKEASDPFISTAIASTLASIHAIKGLPLKLTIHEDGDRLQTKWIQSIKGKIESLREHEAIQMYGADADLLVSFDYETNAKWMRSIFEKFKGRMRKNFILNDMNFLNCLVHDAESGADSIDTESEILRDAGRGHSRVTLIDYDLAHYDYRGKDLGIHFFNRIINYGGTDHRVNPGIELPDANERCRFLQVYQQKIKRLNVWNDFDENGIDSIENLMIESLIGMTHYTLFWATFSTVNFEQFLAYDPMGILLTEAFLKNFLKFKKELDEKLI